FSTAPELDYMLRASGVSILLFEGRVLKRSFVEVLCELEPAIHTSGPGRLESARFPLLRHLAVVDSDREGAIDGWSAFLARSASIPGALVDARSSSVQPSDTGTLFFSSGTTSKPKGVLCSHRAVAIQLWRFGRIFAVDESVRCWAANGFFWSGNVGM